MKSSGIQTNRLLTHTDNTHRAQKHMLMLLSTTRNTFFPMAQYIFFSTRAKNANFSKENFWWSIKSKKTKFYIQPCTRTRIASIAK